MLTAMARRQYDGGPGRGAFGGLQAWSEEPHARGGARPAQQAHRVGAVTAAAAAEVLAWQPRTELASPYADDERE